MRKSVFVFSEYFRGLDQSGLTGGIIALYEAVSVLTQAFEVRIFSFDPAPAPEKLGELSSRTVFLPAPKSGGLRLVVDWNRMLRRAYDEAVENYGRPDAIVAINDTLPVLMLDETRQVKRIAFVQAYENFGVFCPQGSLAERLNGLKRSLKTGLQSKKAIQTADLVVVNSHYVDRTVQSHFGTTRTKVIYPPLSKIFADSPAQSDPSAPFTVGFVTRSSGKNLPFVVALAEKMPEAKFKVFGNLTAPLMQPSNVELMGWFPNRREMFSKAEVWIVPSKWSEPFGMVSVEAQASGRSVFVSNRGGLPETVPTPDRVLSTFDRGLWARRINEAFERPQMPDRDFLEQFQLDRFGLNWLEALSQLVGS